MRVPVIAGDMRQGRSNRKDRLTEGLAVTQTERQESRSMANHARRLE